ncbi:MAG TPA: hypothetical protein VK466_08930 [Terriglobales bacterium]|nr:hypothetical protein [Terriglobales bacterium]
MLPTVVLFTTASLVMGSASQAASGPTRIYSTAEIRAFNETILQTILDLRVKGYGQEATTQFLELHYGLHELPIVQSAPTQIPLSTVATDAAVNPPTIYFDAVHREGIITSSWQWAKSGEAKIPDELGACKVAVNPCTTFHNVGGNDAYGVSTSRGLGWINFSAGTIGAGTNRSLILTDSGPGGAEWKGQDQFKGHPGNPQYTWDYGAEVSGISSWNGCSTVQGFAKISHTWSSTDVTGFSIGVWSIGFQWNSTSNHWEHASQPGNLFKPTGLGC